MTRMAVFQSLFLWNSRPDDGVAVSATSLASFNPCFCGTRARTMMQKPSDLGYEEFQSLFLWNSRPDSAVDLVACPRHRVSILVFVELAPGHESEIFTEVAIQ